MYERMLDKTITPTMADMTAYCADRASLFTALNEWLSAECATTQKIVFPYGKRYGWGVAHHRKNNLICNIFPETNAFCVMLRLTNAQWAEVFEKAQPSMREAIEGRYPCGDGGWVHYRVTGEADFADIQKALALRCA